ncbi:hypothetical protein GCM10025734_47400 [Kitasatospora paranensis]
MQQVALAQVGGDGERLVRRVHPRDGPERGDPADFRRLGGQGEAGHGGGARGGAHPAGEREQQRGAPGAGGPVRATRAPGSAVRPTSR